MKSPSRTGRMLRIRLHNVLRHERFKKCLFHSRTEDNTLRVKIIVGRELKKVIFLDLNVIDGVRNRSSDGRNDSVADGRL